MCATFEILCRLVAQWQLRYIQLDCSMCDFFQFLFAVYVANGSSSFLYSNLTAFFLSDLKRMCVSVSKHNYWPVHKCRSNVNKPQNLCYISMENNKLFYGMFTAKIYILEFDDESTMPFEMVHSNMECAHVST